MSKSKCKRISYRNEKKDVDVDGYVTIEGNPYLVVDSLEELTKHFIETKEGGFKPLDDVSKHKKHLDERRCIFDFEIYLDTLNDFSNYSGLLIFSNSIFLKKVTIKRSYLVSANSKPNTQDYEHECLETSLPEELSTPNFAFWNAKFEDECLIEFDHNKKNLSFIFNQCHFAKKLKIRNSEIRAQLPNGTDFGQYKIAQKTKLHLNKLHLKDCSANDGAYLRIGFVSVKDFALSNLRLPQNAELNIGDCHFENFKLTNFRNIGKFKLYKINILDIKHNYFNGNVYQKNEKEGNKKFQIDNTSIGKTDFQSVNIGSFDDVVIFDNIFTEIDYTNLIWGDKDIGVGQITDDKNELEKKQDTYRTLKNVASKNNDQPQAIKFFAKEMDNIYKLEVWMNFSNKLTLWFNKATNNFGLNWWKPLLILLLLITPLFYLFLLYSLDMPIYNLHHWQYVVQFLNPIHKFDWVIGFFPNLINIAFKVLEGLLLYQVITAFRKYSRKL
jgi:hypothetical protein